MIFLRYIIIELCILSCYTDLYENPLYVVVFYNVFYQKENLQNVCFKVI